MTATRLTALQLVVSGESHPQARVSGHARGAPIPAKDVRRGADKRRGTREFSLSGGRAMQDASDFSLRIVVMAPEQPVRADDHATTTPFTCAPPAGRRPAPGRRAHRGVAPARGAARRSAAAGGSASGLAAAAPPVQPSPSRIKARSLLGVPAPPPTRAAPLSDEEEKRMLRRARACTGGSPGRSACSSSSFASPRTEPAPPRLEFRPGAAHPHTPPL